MDIETYESTHYQELLAPGVTICMGTELQAFQLRITRDPRNRSLVGQKSCLKREEMVSYFDFCGFHCSCFTILDLSLLHTEFVKSRVHGVCGNW